MKFQIKDGILRGYIDNKLVLIKTDKGLKVSCNKQQWKKIKAFLTK